MAEVWAVLVAVVAAVAAHGTGTHHCRLSQIPRMSGLDEQKMSGTWYLSQYFAYRPVNPGVELQDWTLRITPITNGISVDINQRQGGKETPCLPKQTTIRTRISESTYRFVSPKTGQTTEMAVVHTDYDDIALGYICYDIRGDECYQQDLSVLTRQKNPDETIITKASPYLPRQCFMGLGPIKPVQNPDKSCIRKIKSPCSWDNIPVTDMSVADPRMQGFWYSYKEYIHLRRAQYGFNNDITHQWSYNSVRGAFDLTFYVRGHKEASCRAAETWNLDRPDPLRPAEPSYDNGRVVGRIAHLSSSMMIIAYTWREVLIRGNAENLGVVVLTRQIPPSASDIALADQLVKDRLCVDPSAGNVISHTRDCVPAGLRYQAPALNPGIQGIYTSVPGTDADLIRRRIEALQAEKEKLVTEKEMLELEKEKLRLQIALLTGRRV